MSSSTELFFYSLETWDTFSLPDLLTRSCRSARRHALETMNNMMYLRDACFEVMNIDMHPDLRELSLSWLDMKLGCSVPPNIHVRVLHAIKVTDRSLNTIFRGDITYYSTACIGQTRFTTTTQAKNKVADDSCIMFRDDSRQSFGRIRRIFTVNDREPLFYIDTMLAVIDFQCTTSTNIYHYPYICTG